ncbi:membrane-associated protein, putative [Bodo saltans]|uniref:Membrane-associated protein, putative n=1 Tax=Bodo saltans TaxID=75058 RepID=A0A0S4KFW7_BODSA|nr:membrane-associated protein, putative [Bodo saltans]|eukprot:CUI14551.1 membrane-associated protein, putative [Bodo saltans]
MRLLVSPTALASIAVAVGLVWLIVLIVLSLVDSSNQRNADTAATQTLSSLQVRLRAMGDITTGAVVAVGAFAQGGISRSRNTTGNLTALPAIIRRFALVYSPRLVNSAPFPSAIFLARNGNVSQLYPGNASSIFPSGTNLLALGVCNGSFAIGAVVDTTPAQLRHVALCVPVYAIGNITNPVGDYWGYAAVTISEPELVAQLTNGDEQYLLTLGLTEVLVNSYAVGSNEICPSYVLSSITFGRAVLRLWFCEVDADAKLNNPLVWVAVFLLPLGAAFAGLFVFHLVVAISTAIMQRELRLHAPVNPPVALVVIGICNSEILWARYPKVMHHVIKAFNSRIAARRDKLHGLQTEAPLQHTSDIVFKDVQSAILMCMDVIRDLVQNPIIAPDVLQLVEAEETGEGVDEGEVLEVEAAAVAAAEASTTSTTENGTSAPTAPIDGVRMVPIAVSCVIHWCTKVTLRDHDLSSRSVHCQGEDLTLTSRLYHFSASNTVVVSEAAMENSVLNSAENISLQPFGSVLLRGHKTKHSLYGAVSPSYPDVQCPPSIASDDFLKARGARSDVTSNLLPMMSSDVASNSNTGPGDKSQSQLNLNPLQSGHRPPIEDDWDMSRVGGDRRSPQGGNGTTSPDGDDGGSSIPSMRRLLATNIPLGLERQFLAGFDDLAMFNPNLDFKDIKHVIYHYYCAFQTLFRPFAPAEHANIQRRLITTFGVSQDNHLESLAVKCALRQATEVDNLIALQQRKKARKEGGQGSSSDVVSDDQSERGNF